MDTLGLRLKKLREDANLTLEDVAKIVDAKKPSAHHWENDKVKPNAITTLMLARYFGVSPYYLIFGEEDSKNDGKLQKFIKRIKYLSEKELLTDDHIDGLNTTLDIWFKQAEKSAKADDEAKKTA